MRRGILFISIGACGFSPHAVRVDIDAAGEPDTAIADGLPDTAPGFTCFGSLVHDHVCYPDAQIPTGPHPYMAGDTIDTDQPNTCDGIAVLPEGNPCVIAAGSIAITAGAQLHVIGSRPLLLLATEPGGITLGLGTLLDASSMVAQVGAGTTPEASCAGAVAATNKGGGFGGSFTLAGGGGGSGDNDDGHGTPATPLGAPITLHGGCPGGVGGHNPNTTLAAGGGAIALVATTILLDGLVAVGGAAGKSTPTDNAGGNGGGAGGMVVLDTAVLNGSGEVDAKGGGGGEGTGGNDGIDGNAGYNPVNRSAESVGGAGGSSGGDGGHGAPLPNVTDKLAGGTGSGGGGGGGGGGAPGVIVVTASAPSLIHFAPPP